MSSSNENLPEKGNGEEAKQELLNTLLSLQKEQLETRRQELQVHQYNKEQDVKLAEKTIASDEKVELHEITTTSNNFRWMLVVIAILALALLGALLYLSSQGKEGTVDKILTILGAFLGGSGLGYGLGKSGRSSDTPS